MQCQKNHDINNPINYLSNPTTQNQPLKKFWIEGYFKFDIAQGRLARYRFQGSNELQWWSAFSWYFNTLISFNSLSQFFDSDDYSYHATVVVNCLVKLLN